MDPSFTFPRPKPAIPRPQAPSASQGESRESNALRASVLDAALELGLGNNSVVADWMFNNTLQEEEEEVEEPVPSPGLTYGSSATSEESSSFSHRPPPPPVASNPTPLFLSDTRDPQFPKHQGARVAIVPSTVDVPYVGNVTFPEAPVQIPPRPTTPSGRAKLKKKNRGDGYESDGGYVSEAGRKKDKDKKKEKEKEGADEKKEMKARLKEEKKEFKEEERKRKKSLVSAVTRSSSKDNKEKDKDSGYATGYETDGSKHSKSKSKKVKPKSSLGNIGGEYEPDSPSTPLKKSKSRFFKLTTKSSKPNLQEDVVPSPTTEKDKEKEVVPLPIAGRFITGAGAPPVPYIPPPTNPSPILAPGASLASSLALPPPERLPPIATHALDLDSALTSSPVSAVTSPSVLSSLNKKQADRDSRSSASSGSSGGSNPNPRRRGLQFSPTHANGSGSFSTITSTSQSHSHSHGHGPPPSSMIYSPPNSAQGHLKPPSISFPVTRSPSPHGPLSPVAPLNVVKGLKTKASLDAIPSNHYANSSRGVSPIPLSPDSPYVMVTPTSTTSSSSPPNIITSPNPLVRPRNPPTNGFGPRIFTQTQTQPSSASPVPPPSPHVHFPFAAHEKPTHLSIVPSEDWVVPSPSSSQTSHQVITPPSVLAYYDIPPPSPPPVGPLPVPPTESGGAGGNGAGGAGSAGVFPTTSQLRARMHERGAKEFNQLVNRDMQRGRELPFPARPILPATSNTSSSNATLTTNSSRNNGNGGVGPGLEARVNVRRYRDLYAAPAGGWPEPQPQSQRRPHQSRSDEGEGGYHAEPEEEEEEEDMKDVLNRFEDSDSDTDFINPLRARALETRRSFEAIKPKAGHESFAVEEYYGTRDRDTIYSFADAYAGDRNSRWSGSIYSRNSILDPDKSEEARERFLERVEAMLGGDEDERRGGVGRGRQQVVPPVPDIPERFASPRKNWPPGKF